MLYTKPPEVEVSQFNLNALCFSRYTTMLTLWRLLFQIVQLDHRIGFDLFEPSQRSVFVMDYF